MSTQTLTIYPPSPLPPSTPDAALPSIATNPNSFLWTEQKLRAISLMADGRYDNKEVSQMVGITEKVLRHWQNNSIFQARLNDAIEEYKARILNATIAQKHYRIASLQERHSLLNQVLLQRQKQTDPSSQFYNPIFADVPGLDTGLVLPSLGSTKIGMHDYIITHDYKLDTALLNEFRAIEKQAAEETGQWSETHNINILQKAYIGIDIAQV